VLTVAKQPILDQQGRTFAYELFNRSGGKHPSQEILQWLINDIDIQERFGNKKLFLNIDEETLLNDTVFLISPDHFVIEILETVDLTNDTILQKLWKLKEAGYKLALDDFVCEDQTFKKYEPYLPLFDIIKFDLKGESKNDIERLKKEISTFKKFGFSLLAEKVETEDEFTQFKQMGFDYFQGYFFAKPVETKEPNIDSTRLQLLEVLALLEREAEIDEIEEALKRDPQLTIALLKYINSPYFGFQQEVSSVRFAITLIGPRRLKHWIGLMLYAAGDGDPSSNPLYQLVKTRAELLSAIAIEIGVDKEKAFLTGLLSAADVLFKTSMKELVNKLKIDAEVKEALVNRSNVYGKMLGLVIAYELDNKEAIEAYLKELGLTLEQFAKITTQAAI